MQYRITMTVEQVVPISERDDLEVSRTMEVHSLEELHETIQRVANAAMAHFDEVEE